MGDLQILNRPALHCPCLMSCVKFHGFMRSGTHKKRTANFHFFSSIFADLNWVTCVSIELAFETCCFWPVSW